MHKYLIIGPSWIGDMIMANALFRRLKKENPDCQIHVLAPAWSHPVIARMPEVHKAIVMPLQHGVFNVYARYRLGQSLRAEKYTHAIVLPNSWKSALIPYFAKIPKRTGWRGEWRYGLLNNIKTLDKKRYSLMVERYLCLANNDIQREGSLKIEDFYPQLSVDFFSRDNTMEKYHISIDKPLLILCPGAQYGNSKRWPEAYFSQVAQHYIAQGWQVAFLGGKAEAGLVAKMNVISAIDLTSTTLTEAIDLMSLAKVVVSNDSGLMHMACALNKPIIAIYGSSSPDFTPPLGAQATILSKTLPCKPCFKRECPLGHLHCLTKITPEEVIDLIGSFESVCQ